MQQPQLHREQSGIDRHVSDTNSVDAPGAWNAVDDVCAIEIEMVFAFVGTKLGGIFDDQRK
jgi:hypothetical protein